MGELPPVRGQCQACRRTRTLPCSRRVFRTRRSRTPHAMLPLTARRGIPGLSCRSCETRLRPAGPWRASASRKPCGRACARALARTEPSRIERPGPERPADCCGGGATSPQGMNGTARHLRHACRRTQVCCSSWGAAGLDLVGGYGKGARQAFAQWMTGHGSLREVPS